MLKYLLYTLILFSGNLLAQPMVFNKVTNQIEYARNIFRCGSNYLITFGVNFADDFGVTVIDSAGNIINDYHYGDGQAWEELTFSRRQSNDEILLMGLNFWDDSLQTNIGDFKGYVMVTDTMGILKKAFRIKRNTTQANRIYNGLYMEGSYYFVGEERDSIVNNNFFSNLFYCKTDTLGNILWYHSFPQFKTETGFTVGFEYSFDKSSILIGASIYDSIVGNTAYMSYFLIKTDTDGNYINRIPVPEFASNVHYDGLNNINAISQIFHDKYLVCGDREHYILDNQYNILDSFDLVLNIHPARFGYKNLFEDSYFVGGVLGFTKVYQSNDIFTKDWGNELDIVSIQDMQPTYDGGYVAIILNSTGSTHYIKTDCEGNYVNPIYCWPTSAHELTKVDFQMSYKNHQISFDNKSEFHLDAKLFDTQGRPLQTFYIQKGLTKNEISNYASGIYIISIFNDNVLIKSEKLLIE